VWTTALTVDEALKQLSMSDAAPAAASRASRLATMKSLIARLTGMISGMSAARIWAMKTGSLTVLLLRCVIDSVSVGERPTPDAGEPMSGAGHPEGRGLPRG
jgi:hypothetical protein